MALLSSNERGTPAAAVWAYACHDHTHGSCRHAERLDLLRRHCSCPISTNRFWGPSEHANIPHCPSPSPIFPRDHQMALPPQPAGRPAADVAPGLL